MWGPAEEEEDVELGASETLQRPSSYQSSSGCHAAAISGSQRPLVRIIIVGLTRNTHSACDLGCADALAETGIWLVLCRLPQRT